MKPDRPLSDEEKLKRIQAVIAHMDEFLARSKKQADELHRDLLLA